MVCLFAFTCLMFILRSFLQLLCLIGEAFEDYSDEICGAVVNIRNKGDKLALWTHDATKKEATVKIGCVKFSYAHSLCVE